MEATDRVLPLAPIPWRWKHIDFFMEVAVQEGIVHIHLMQGPIADSSNSKETTNSDELSNRGKGFGVIDALTLGVALGNQAGFVSFNGTIRLVFNLENSLTADRTMTSRQGSERPGVVLLQSCDFRIHSGNPLRVMSCLLIGAGFNQLRNMIDKYTMRCREIGVRHIPSDRVTGARRA